MDEKKEEEDFLNNQLCNYHSNLDIASSISSFSPPNFNSTSAPHWSLTQRFDKIETDGKLTFGKVDFEEEELSKVKTLLKQKLGPEHTKTRPGPGGKEITYVESHKAVELANEVFNFNGWSDSIVDITPDFIEEYTSGHWRCAITCVIRITLKDGTFHEDVGFGCAENPSKALAIENSKKEAVSDARKRAFRLFGNYLGNSLYDANHLKKISSGSKHSNDKLKELKDGEVKEEIKKDSSDFHPRPLHSYLPPSYNPHFVNVQQNLNSNTIISNSSNQSFTPNNNSIPTTPVTPTQVQHYSPKNTSPDLASSNLEGNGKHPRDPEEIDEEFEAQLLLETEQIANQFYTSQHSDGKGLIPPEKKRKTE